MSEINKEEISAFAAQLVADKLSSGKDNGELRAEIEAKINEKIAHETERNQIMRKLQLEELEILRYFDAFCREHKLHYYIVGGTLIGAVRHKGFIPWDDDIDVSMPRKDFDRLLKIAEEKLSPDYFLQNQKTEKGCYFYYAKLRKNGTYFGEDKFEHLPLHKGIFIDIFPLDFLPSQSILQKLSFKAFSLLGGFICSKEKTTEFLYKNMSLPFIVTFRILQCLLPKWFLLSFRKFLGKLLNLLSNKKYLASLSGFHGYPQEVCPAELWGEGVDIEFEGTTVRAPSEYHRLLTHMFGDYMVLPPEEDRVNHSVETDKIRFSGCTNEDYKPKIKRKRSHRYYSVDYDVYPIE
ncbi:MAG: LicD family protein [Eubacteriales bacterium]|nr:LicD family protein [Eubacteriales bacterium]